MISETAQDQKMLLSACFLGDGNFIASDLIATERNYLKINDYCRTRDENKWNPIKLCKGLILNSKFLLNILIETNITLKLILEN